jgi:ELWxxDGT repeat protein
MLKDILPGSSSSDPAILGVHDDILYFSASDGVHGTELWKSDGTTQGTSMVKDIFLGSGSSDPFIVKIQGETLYIRANDGAHGTELWRSDGSESGTQLIKDINPGPSGSLSEFPSFTGLYFTPFNSDLFFTADDGSHGIELWKTDGTSAGTQMLKDFSAGSASSYIADLHILNGALIILESPLSGGTYGLWRSDGTTSGTTLLKNDFVGNFVATTGGQLFFEVDDANIVQLFKTDGTFAGTSLVYQFLTGVKNITGFADLNEFLYFTINLSPEGMELWRSDGTPAGTKPVLQNERGVSPLGTWNGNLLLTRDISDPLHELWIIDGATQIAQLLKGTGPDQINVVGTILLDEGNQFYFLDYDHAHSSALWRSDGTPAGTQSVRSLTGTGDLSVKDLTSIPSSVYFKGNSGSFPTDQVNLYRLNPDGQVNQILAEIGTSFWAEGLFVIDKNLLFVVDAKNPFQPAGLWRSDGTPLGTDLLLAEPNPNGYLSDFTFSGNQLFFIAHDSSLKQTSLWRTDGSSTGTWMVLDLSNIGLTFIADVNGVLFGVGSQGDRENFLMVTDGTPAGTRIIQEFPGDFFFPQYLSWNGALFFQGLNALWVSSGTTSGTRILVQFANTFIQGLTKTDRLVFFNADDGSHGVELWKTDGTQANTSLVKDIYPGSGGSDPQPVASIGSTLYFTAEDGIHGRELWRSDGTEAGTYLVKDILPGVESAQPDSFAVLGDALYFAADDGVHGRELWRSDGSEAGTAMVKDILPGARSSAPKLSVQAGRLYLAANDGLHGIEPWISDGTESGTFLMGDVNPGPSSSQPEGFTYWRGKVYFEAGDFEHGRELWVYDLGLTARSYMPLLAR